MAREKTIPISDLKGGMYKIVFDLPSHYNEGIGKLIMTHAILETKVAELLFDLAGTSYPAGRISFGYRNASDRFSTVINLFDLHGITPSLDLNQLRNQIKDCCTARDTFAHNVWIEERGSGQISIRITKGTMETPDGKHNLKFLPTGQKIPDGYFEDTCNRVKETIGLVLELQQELQARKLEA